MIGGIVVAVAPFAIMRVAGWCLSPRQRIVLFSAFASIFVWNALLRRWADLRRDHRAILARVCGAIVVLIAVMPSELRGLILASKAAVVPFILPLALHAVVGLRAGFAAASRQNMCFRLKLEALFSELLPNRLARVAAFDMDLLSHLLPRMRTREAPPAMIPFTYHHHVRPMMVAFLVLAGLEAAVAHLLLLNAAAWFRWTVFAVDDLGLLYLAALVASLSRLPLLVGRGMIRVRAGTFIDVAVPATNIAAVRTDFTREEIGKGTKTLRGCLLAHPIVMLDLVSPMEVDLPIRGVRSIRKITLHPDDPAAFCGAVAALVAAGASIREREGQHSGAERRRLLALG